MHLTSYPPQCWLMSKSWVRDTGSQNHKINQPISLKEARAADIPKVCWRGPRRRRRRRKRGRERGRQACMCVHVCMHVEVWHWHWILLKSLSALFTETESFLECCQLASLASHLVLGPQPLLQVWEYRQLTYLLVFAYLCEWTISKFSQILVTGRERDPNAQSSHMHSKYFSHWASLQCLDIMIEGCLNSSKCWSLQKSKFWGRQWISLQAKRKDIRSAGGHIWREAFSVIARAAACGCAEVGVHGVSGLVPESLPLLFYCFKCL